MIQALPLSFRHADDLFGRGDHLARNPVHSVLWLILAFFNAAGLMILIGAEFIAMLLVIVYVGAVAVLFLFVVMMLDIDFAQLRAGFIKNFPLGFALAFVLLAELVMGVGAYKAGGARHARRGDRAGGGPVEHRRDRGAALFALSLPVRNRRHHPAGGDDRRHRADPSPAWRRARPEAEQPDLAPSGRGDHQSSAGSREGVTL
jgi:hypothetical protein